MGAVVELSDVICQVQGLSDRIDCLLWLCGGLLLVHLYWIIKGII